jgi:adenosylmethionine-8-amino-7-oxononanoate aminotransferase
VTRPTIAAVSRALFPRSFAKSYPVAVRGEGVWLWDAAGKRYLDFAGGAAVNFIGHGRAKVADAMARQARELAFVHSSQFANEPAGALAAALLEFAGPGFAGGSVYFTSGGSESVETALKLARQYHVERGDTRRFRVLSRRQSYHGSTFGAMSVSGNRRRREMYSPMLPPGESPEINTPYCYRCPYSCSECAAQYAKEIERAFLATAGDAAAFIFEPVSGATLGAAVPPPGYLEQVRDICTRHGALLIADEVMTGCGRTGTNFAVDHWGVVPDILVTAKSLSSGYAPLGAVIARAPVVEAIASGSGSFVHGFTYNAHPVSAAAGLAVMDIVRQEKLVQSASSANGVAGSAMAKALAKLKDCPSVGDVRGIGLLWGVEFVTDQASRRPFSPEAAFSARVAAAATERGVLVYPMQGCADGTSGDHVLIAPPAIISAEEVDWAVGQLREVITAVERDGPAKA